MAKKANLADLAPNPKNPRTISDGKKKMLAEALRKYGDLGGVIYNRRSKMLVGGHQRRQAFLDAHAEGVTLERTYAEPTKTGTVAEGYIAVAGEKFAYREVDWAEDIERGACVAANKGAGEFDMPVLQEMLGDLQGQGFDMDLTMFDAEELAAMFPEVEQVDPEPEEDDSDGAPAVETDVLHGQVYQLGDHRLMCGDSFSQDDVELLLGEEKAQLIFTDPPYNIAGENKLVAKGIRAAAKRLADSEWDKDFAFDRVEKNLLWALAEDASVYICTSHFLFGEIIAWMQTWSSHFSHCVWTKSNPMPSLQKRHWTWNTELICYATRGKHTFNFPEEGHALSTWSLAKNIKNDLHPTMKPIAVPAHAIAHSSKQGDIVVDLFGGAGSTLMACEQLGRRARLMELAPKYVQTIINRWEKETGGKAELL